MENSRSKKLTQICDSLRVTLVGALTSGIDEKCTYQE